VACTCLSLDGNKKPFHPWTSLTGDGNEESRVEDDRDKAREKIAEPCAEQDPIEVTE
jgi:hypothetical protein